MAKIEKRWHGGTVGSKKCPIYAGLRGACHVPGTFYTLRKIKNIKKLIIYKRLQVGWHGTL
jgi:hypothetical protein